jgi:hypothetical protein
MKLLQMHVAMPLIAEGLSPNAILVPSQTGWDASPPAQCLRLISPTCQLSTEFCAQLLQLALQAHARGLSACRTWDAKATRGDGVRLAPHARTRLQIINLSLVVIFLHNNVDATNKVSHIECMIFVILTVA